MSRAEVLKVVVLVLFALVGVPRVGRAQDAGRSDAAVDSALTTPAATSTSAGDAGVDAATANPASGTAEASAGPALQPVAPADEDSLTLRDGSLLRGRVTALEVGRQVVLVVTGGEARTVAWRDIASAEGPTFRTAHVVVAPSPPPPPRVAYNPATADLLHPAPGQVPLVVESDGAPQRVGVTLSIEEIGTGFESARIVRRRVLCTTPCALYVRPGPFALFATAPTLVETTSVVEVAPTGTRVRLYATPRGVRNAAIGFTLAGVAGALGSILTLVIVGGSVSPLTLGIIAAATFGGSALIALPGIILFAANPTGVHSAAPLEPPRAVGAAASSALMVPLVRF